MRACSSAKGKGITHLFKNGWIWIAILALLFALLMVVPIDVVYEVPVKGKVYPAREWKLMQADGEFHTEETSFLKDCNEAARTFVFERGDVIDINYNEHVHNNSHVEKGTHLLSFSSMMHLLDVQRAENEQQIQQSLYRADATPDKAPDIKEAEQELLRRQSNEKLQKANFDRLTALYSEGVISKFELDVQLNALEVAQQETKSAQQRIESLKFGEKREDLDVFQARVSTAENELKVLRGRSDSYAVKAPWSGLIQMAPMEGVVVQLTDTMQKVMLFPINVHELQYINKKSMLCKERGEKSTRKSFDIEQKVQVLNGRQVSMGITRVDGSDLDIGLFTDCLISCDTIRLGEYLKRRIF